MAVNSSTPKPLITAGLFLGIGLGGFLDGIVFHQILQTHSMLSATLPRTSIANIEVNMFWDGIFHACTWIMTVAGISLLWRAGRRSTYWSGQCLGGACIAGWGFFNLVEGIINHHLLNLHHVVEKEGLSVFDYAFLAFSVLLVVLGFTTIGASRDSTVRRRQVT